MTGDYITHEHEWDSEFICTVCDINAIGAYEAARATITRLEGERDKRIAQLSSEARELLRITEQRDALAALVVELRGHVLSAKNFAGASHWDGSRAELASRMSTLFDRLTDALALDTSAAERLLAERDARVVEPWRAVAHKLLNDIQIITDGDYAVDASAHFAEARALLGSYGAPTEADAPAWVDVMTPNGKIRVLPERGAPTTEGQ